MEWEEFTTRFGAELHRLGISDQEARFLGFDEPDERLFEVLALLPDRAGAAAFYAHLGADLAELERQEAELRESPPPDA
jgi:hypothetical protein